MDFACQSLDLFGQFLVLLGQRSVRRDEHRELERRPRREAWAKSRRRCSSLNRLLHADGGALAAGADLDVFDELTDHQ